MIKTLLRYINNKIPEIKEIDPRALDLDLSLVEYLALLSKTNFRFE
jgi:hypothetical protein